MRAVLEDMRSGRVAIHDVPSPELRPGGILVRTHFSAISAGTERVKVETGKKTLVQKALTRPDLVKQVLEYARSNGVKAAYQKVQARLDTLTPLGYSAAGTVLEVAADVHEFRPGDRVACAGGGYANHAEVNFTPRNLAVHVPEPVRLDAASLTTIGAIALQGLRQAQVSLGDTVAVVGAGLVGILTIQMARAAGCRVIAIDRDPERAHRATTLGADLGLVTNDPRLLSAVQQFSRYGADVSIITAATSSAEPLELAAEIVRDRGRIVVVGDVGMGVQRSNLYGKELSVVMSRSYGPGRYDAQYEERGIDYPIGYVRWTEKRNMEAFLDLLAKGALNVAPLLERRYPVEEGARAYADICSNGAYTAIIEYGCAPEGPAVASPCPQEPISQAASGKLSVGCIGAGNFARSIVFPNLRASTSLLLGSVATSSGVAAESARKSFGFLKAESPAQLLRNPDIDAVFIISRHDSHAPYLVEALANRKAVFVEKPLATNREQLESICTAYQAHRAEGHSSFVMVGFNRRFAPATDQIREFFAGRHEPMMIQIRVNAGYFAKGHWVHEHGGRIVGELCHFVDWARSLVAAPIQTVSALALPDGARYKQDNAAVTLSFADGSIASLLYLANGDKCIPKEHFEVFCEGGTARLEDFNTLILARNGKERRVRCRHDKGHKRELEATTKALCSGSPSPIPFAELVEVTEATFAVQEAIASGKQISLGKYRM